MIYIGKREDSNLLIGVSKSRKLFHVSAYDARHLPLQEIRKLHTERLGEDCEIVPNFTFMAHIVPTSFVSTDTGKYGGIVFIDYDDPRMEYIMSQQSLLEFLQCIISGEVEVASIGYYGLFTFTAAYGKFTIKVYKGE